MNRGVQARINLERHAKRTYLYALVCECFFFLLVLCSCFSFFRFFFFYVGGTATQEKKCRDCVTNGRGFSMLLVSTAVMPGSTAVTAVTQHQRQREETTATAIVAARTTTANHTTKTTREAQTATTAVAASTATTSSNIRSKYALLGQQSRFGDKLLGIRVDCPQNGTAVLKWLKQQQNINNYTDDNESNNRSNININTNITTNIRQTAGTRTAKHENMNAASQRYISTATKNNPLGHSHNHHQQKTQKGLTTINTGISNQLNINNQPISSFPCTAVTVSLRV